MPNFLDRILYGSSASPWDLSQTQPKHVSMMPTDLKTAYELMKVGMKGRPQYPGVNQSSLMKAYCQNEIVHSAIEIRALAGTDPSLHVQQRTAQGEWQEVEGHPMRRLIIEPNENLDEAGFFRCFSVSVDVSGRFYAEIVRGPNGLPAELHPLNPFKVAPIPDGEGGIAEYEYKEGTQRIKLPVEDVLAYTEYNVFDKWQPISRLGVVLGAIDADTAQTDFIREFFNNAGVPSGMLKILGRKLTPEQADAIRAQWMAKYSRLSGLLHNVAVLDENAEYQKLGAGLNELESKELRLYTQTSILSTFGVPPLIIYAYAGLDKATYSNLQEAWKWFWNTTMSATFTGYRRWLTKELLTEFHDKELILSERIRLYHNFDEVKAMQEDVTQKQQRARENFRAGLLKLNEARAILGEQPDPDGDYYLRPQALVPVYSGDVLANDIVKRLRAMGQEVKLLPSPGRAPTHTKAKATRARLQKRIERDMQKFIARQYEAVASEIEAAA